MNKILKIFSIIFESSFIGSVILYIYNYYIGIKKYDVIPKELQDNLNIFMIIGIASLIIFIVIRFILSFRTKVREPKEEPIKTNNMEDVLTERVIIYKDSYEIPKENRMICPNCNNIIDKNAFICLKCGYLLKPIETSSVNTVKVIKTEGLTRKQLINMLVNIGLVIAIIICILMIISIAMERGIIK